jgi:hypothetical protein
MKRVRIIGLALVAVFAMSAVAAASASAREYVTEKARETSSATTTNTQKFTAGTNVVTCKKATFSWSKQPEKAKTFTVAPTYEECEVSSFFGVKATVNMGTCKYQFNEPTGTTEPYKATVDLIPTCEIKITASICEIKIKGEQKGLEGVEVKNLNKTPGSFEGEVKANVKNIKYTTNGGCPGETSGNGVYEGTVVEKGVIVE